MNATTTGTIVEQNTQSTAAKTSLDVINAIYPPLLIVVGVTCNILVILVMRTKYFRSQSSSVFMIAGAVNDALSLLLSMTTHWLYVTFDGIYYKNNVKNICKFLDFYGWGNCDLGILLTSTMTVERALDISFPLQRLASHSAKKGRITVAILVLIVVAKEFHFLIGSNMVDESRGERLCDVYPTSQSYQVFWKEVWPWLHLGFLIICFLIIIVSNAVLVHQVWKSAQIKRIRTVHVLRTHAKNRPSQGNYVNFIKIEKQWRTITPMLIGESFVLLILTFPFTIQLSVSGYNPEFYQSYEMGLLFSVTFYMLYTNKCVTFFVYLVTGARFRLELKRIFHRCLHKPGKYMHYSDNLFTIFNTKSKIDTKVGKKKVNSSHYEDILPYSTSVSSEFTHL